MSELEQRIANLEKRQTEIEDGLIRFIRLLLGEKAKLVLKQRFKNVLFLTGIFGGSVVGAALGQYLAERFPIF